MEPASSSGAGGGGGRQLKRWGPIIGVLAVVVVGVVVLVVTRGGDDDDSGGTVATTAPPTTAPTDTSAPSDTTGPTDTTAPGGIEYPLSYSRAVELGIENDIDWGERCDTEVGRIAVPDFFAPECYAPFQGDNGGATAQGVTAEEITVVYYEGLEGDPIIRYVTDAIAVTDTNQQQFEMMRNIVRYYETYYELYGRKVKLVTFEGTGLATDPVAARADAARIAAEFKPFVVLGGPALTSAFADELAANKIMCIGCTPGQPSEFYADRDPYVWSLGMSSLQGQTHIAEFVGKQLAGKNAEYAGPALVDQPRKFGYVYLESSDASSGLANEFAQRMADVGAPFAEMVGYELNPATIQASAAQIITKMKAAGVTTIVFSGDPVAPRDFTKEATAQEYFPEWFNAGSGLVDTNAFARTYDQEQWKHAFGLTTLAARTDPTKIGYYPIYEWFNGEPPPAPDTIGVIQPNPALFFAVLQQVGPNLTAENWRNALFSLSGTTRDAISQPYLSWGDKGYWPDFDYHGIDDATLQWWDPNAEGPDEIRKQGKGMYQFVDGGKRYLPGQWPADEKLFDPDGAVAIYLTPPPGEEPRQYPSPAG